MLEEDADVESRRAPAVNTKTSTASRARIRRALPFRVIWALLSAIRRAMLDFGVGVLIMLAVSLMVGGGWRRARRTLSRFLIGARDAISGEWQNATRSQVRISASPTSGLSHACPNRSGCLFHNWARCLEMLQKIKLSVPPLRVPELSWTDDDLVIPGIGQVDSLLLQ